MCVCVCVCVEREREWQGREEKRVRSSENMYMCIEGKRERRYIYFKNVLYMVQKNTEAKF